MKIKFLILSTVVFLSLGVFAENKQPVVSTPLPTHVSAPKKISDKDIQERLTRIFETSGWYPQLRIDVKEGLVFLKGKISSPKKKEWATKMIEKTEGVVGMIDDLDGNVDTNVLSPMESEVNNIRESISRTTPYILSAAVIFLIFVGLSWLARRVARATTFKRSNNELIASSIANFVGLAFLILGLYLALRTSGLSALAVSVLGGTGFLGIGLGLALKSTFENYSASVMISMREIFRRGEWIRIGEHEGIVHSVSTRGTTLMDFNGNTIVIPNAQVFNSVIINMTRNPNMRAFVDIGVGYADSIEQAQEIILNVISNIAGVLKEPASTVMTREISGGTVSLRVFFWLDAAKTGRAALCSEVLRQIKQALQEAGMSLPTESRDITFVNHLELSRKRKEESDAVALPEESVTPVQPLTNDVELIRQQAQKTPAPEKGTDILLK